MIKLATTVQVTVEYDRRRQASVLLATAGPLVARTKPYGGRWTPEQARQVWLRQPELFRGEAAEGLRRLPVA